MSRIKIYLANLGKYNEGELKGKWVELPATDDELESIMNEIGIGESDEFGQPYEEFFIADYESDVNISIGEYDDIYELNELAEELNEFDDSDIDFISLYMEEVSDDLSNAMDTVRNSDFVVWYDCNNMSDVAYEYIKECGGVDSLPDDFIERYFNYRQFGKELRWDFSEEDEQEYGFTDMTDLEVAYAYIDMLGNISELGKDTISTYFDYDAYGRDLEYEGVFRELGNNIVEFF